MRGMGHSYGILVMATGTGECAAWAITIINRRMRGMGHEPAACVRGRARRRHGRSANLVSGQMVLRRAKLLGVGHEEVSLLRRDRDGAIKILVRQLRDRVNSSRPTDLPAGLARRCDRLRVAARRNGCGCRGGGEVRAAMLRARVLPRVQVRHQVPGEARPAASHPRGCDIQHVVVVRGELTRVYLAARRLHRHACERLHVSEVCARLLVVWQQLPTMPLAREAPDALGAAVGSLHLRILRIPQEDEPDPAQAPHHHSIPPDLCRPLQARARMEGVGLGPSIVLYRQLQLRPHAPPMQRYRRQLRLPVGPIRHTSVHVDLGRRRPTPHHRDSLASQAIRPPPRLLPSTTSAATGVDDVDVEVVDHRRLQFHPQGDVDSVHDELDSDLRLRPLPTAIQRHDVPTSVA